MKKILLIVGVAGGMVALNSFAALDGTVTMNYGPYNGGGGGEFSAQTSPSAGSPNLGNFLTFCLEHDEYFNPGGTYSYIINSGAVAGGAGADATDTHAQYYGTTTYLPMDNISIGTAYLYSQFARGLNPITSNSQAEDLQQAIWYLEGEYTGTLSAGANSLLLGAYNGINSTTLSTLSSAELLTLEGDSNGAYGVVALNLYSQSPINGAPTQTEVTIGTQTWYAAQDQLAVVPEATTIIAGLLLFLPLGASTLRILRRNRMT